ncbi:MAG: Histidine triad (HIT) protein [Candidatus Uhrbacteria bacterium GW2011_GWD2_52_7]|uniref:Histidine triad (HIT) protein n=1 Tax=Candidatus Uhrbacteria bacterium GW2011_GWD2_52_7 TaxID=1618989 RepID=A0A0G1XGF6_9BACT|nr:MAG: Histidine triad (HIT) protein [Candidatus Uhrbacteria bacterium GW2011_GWD2_52_7]
MTNCLFCKIIAGDIPALKVFEDEKTFAFLDIGPVSKGHTLVVPKVHAENLSVGTHEDAGALMEAIHHLAPRIMKALGAQGYNLGMNHGEVAGQEVMHTHVHIMPRFAGQPRTFAKTHPSKEELEAIAAAIVAQG